MPSRLITDLKNICGEKCAKHLDLMREINIDYIVTCTLRSFDEQDRLYKIGRVQTPKGFGKIVTNAKAGQSAHQYGLAYDIAIIIDGKLNWNANHNIWQKAIELGKECGLDSLYPMEAAHFQVPNWKSHIPKK